MRGIARAAHQRDRESAGHCDVGRAAAGDRAEQAARDHRGLGGTPPEASDQREGDVDEDVADPGVLQNDAEDDKQEHIGREDIRDRPVNAALAVEVGDDLVEAEAAVRQRFGNAYAKQRVAEKNYAEQRQDEPENTPAHFEGDDRHHRTENHVVP